jgi:hypothetical protein
MDMQVSKREMMIIRVCLGVKCMEVEQWTVVDQMQLGMTHGHVIYWKEIHVI